MDENERRKIEEIARLYLEEDVSLDALGKRCRMNPSNLHKILTKRSGSTWRQRFVKADCGIDVSVETSVPPLLPEPTIEKIRAKCIARRTWDHGSLKNDYLLSRIIFDAETGYALTGTPNAKGKRYYRPYKGSGRAYIVNADLLERAVTETLFEALSTNRSLQGAVFDGAGAEGAVDKLAEEKRSCEAEVKKIDRQYVKLKKAVEKCQAEGVQGFIESILPDLKKLESLRADLTFRIDNIRNELQSLPTVQEIENVRTLMTAQLLKAVKRSYFDSGLSFEKLPFKGKRRIITLLFGGHDQRGRRYGIYVDRQPGMPKRYRFEAYGKLGDVQGWIEGRGRRYASGVDPDMYTRENSDLNTAISRVIVENDPQLIQPVTYDKAHVHCERDAHHCICIHKR